MSTSIVLNSESFTTAADAFRTRCSVPILIILAEDNNATDTTPPNLAFKVPETSILCAVAKAVLEGFRKFLPEPNNAPLFWLSQEAGGKEPVSWTAPVGLLAQMKQHERDEEDQRPAAIKGGPSNNSNNSSPNGGAPPASSVASPFASQVQNVGQFKKPHIIFPLKLYANFRVTKRGEVFPFHAAHMNGAELVKALHDNVLHSVKRSVAIMNTVSYESFVGKLNPQDMEALYDLCLMDSVSLTKRTALARFHKDILSTIDVHRWPVMIHSMESGRMITLAIPAKVSIDSNINNNTDEVGSGTMNNNNNNKNDDGNEKKSPAGSPVVVMGIQGQFIAHREVKKKTTSSSPTSNTKTNNNNSTQQQQPTDEKNLRPTTYGDLVRALYSRMVPGHLSRDGNESHDEALQLLRRRMVIAGLPDAPLSETPLRWLMEHLVGADLALHVLLLPPNVHSD